MSTMGNEALPFNLFLTDTALSSHWHDLPFEFGRLAICGELENPSLPVQGDGIFQLTGIARNPTVFL